MFIVLSLISLLFVAPKEKSMLCLGDSYTIGQSVAESERFPEQTISILQNKKINFQSPEIIARTGWTCTELANAIEARQIKTNYDVVTLLIGVNDQFRGHDTASYTKNFENLLRTAIDFANNKTAHVFVLSIPDYGVTPFAANAKQTPGQIEAEINIFNAINKRISEKYNVHYLDITPISRMAASDISLLASDGLHPSGKMYSKWAQKLADQITAEFQ